MKPVSPRASGTSYEVFDLELHGRVAARLEYAAGLFAGDAWSRESRAGLTATGRRIQLRLP